MSHRAGIAICTLALAALGLGALGLAACSSKSSGHGNDGGVDPPGPDAAPPAATCEAPALIDTSTPTMVVGTGTAASCTEAALQTAATAGGIVTFDCGAAPVTIALTAPVTVALETVIDGNSLVTLDGGGATRLLYLDSNYNTATPRLTVQRLSFANGRGPGSGDDTAQGGGAIYRNGGSLTVIDCAFDGNHATATGQDTAGGAIYGFGGGDTTIAGSTFTNNAASDGGAVGSLNGDLVIVNSTFANNAATGSGGNPGDGGCGGAIYQDGGKEMTSLCGVTIANNTAGAIGGSYFRVSNDHTGTFAMDRSTVDSNTVTPTASGNAGGMYLEGLALTMTASTISRNQAYYNGGLWLTTDTPTLTNVTIAGNIAFGSNGGGLWLDSTPTGKLINVTIANNQATGGVVAGAIFGPGLTLQNTLIANNTAMYTPTCDTKRTDGSGNVQWPADDAPCTTSPAAIDPLLGALGSNGGDTATLLPGAAKAMLDVGADCPPTDQRGNSRGTPCTAGAVELP